MRTGRHTGDVPFRIELHTDEPELDASWQDAVEVLFSSWSEELMLSAFESSEGPVDLPVGVYRARYCAKDMQRGRDDLDTAPDDELVDSYLLQLWPANDLDRVVRRSDDPAASPDRDRFAVWSREELAARVSEIRKRRSSRQDEEHEAELDETWGGQVPDDPRLREAGWSAAQLQELDPSLLHALVEADDPLRRAVTAWAVEQVLSNAGLLQLPWAAPALAALRDGRVPDPDYELTSTLPPIPESYYPESYYDDVTRQHLAVGTLHIVGNPDGTLRNVCEALVAADSEHHVDGILERVRQVFPQLS
jgi:hypothetical protein